MYASSTAANLSDAQTALLEKVHMDPVRLYSILAGLSNNIQGMKRVTKVNQRAYQIHQELYPGGSMQIVDRDGGSLGSGSGPRAAKLQGGIYYLNFGIELTDKLMSQTEGGAPGGGSANGGSVIDAFKLSVANGMQTISRHFDRYLWNDGTGYLTEGAAASPAPSSSTGVSSFTFKGGSDYRGVSHLLEGMAVDIYNSAGTKCTNATRATYPFIIDQIDWAAKTVYLLGQVSNPLGGGAAAGMRLAVVGLPSTPTSFSSAWPYGTDTFLHGIPYANDTNLADYYLGTLRSTRPNMNCKTYDGNTSFWSTFMTQNVRDQLLDGRGAEALNGLEGYVHMAQRVQVQATGQAITNFPRQAKSEILDPAPSSGRDAMVRFEWSDTMHNIVPQQFRNRIDYINWSVWERPEDFPGPRPLKMPEGGFGQRLVDLSTGGRRSIVQWLWEASLDFCCLDPGIQACITNLAVPVNY